MSSIKSPRRSPLLVLALLTAVVLLAIGAPRARADVASTIIQRCTHGQSLSGFSQAAYRKALHDLPTEVGEYSDCVDLIHHAALAAATGASRTSPSGATASPGTTGANSAGAPLATPITPVEQKALRHAHRGGAAPVQVDGEVVHPGVVHADVASAFSSLPTPLLVLLCFLVACAALIVGKLIRDHVRARDNG
jgi:hypothetical protein